METAMFNSTAEQKIALSMAYLAYSGENIISTWPADESVPQKILDIVNTTIPKISVLSPSGNPDWRVTWGPAIYTFDDAILQDNMMFVAQSISDPSKYVVAVRGTNGTAILDWVEEDFDVWKKTPWELPVDTSDFGSPKISKATQLGTDALLNKMVPAQKLPGAGQTITDYLTWIAAQGSINLTFTGHSLAGALAPTLALWFKQRQGENGGWDVANNASISVISFAGATPGDQDFANYFNSQLGSQCQRIWNTLDMVPHAWQTSTLSELPALYSAAGIKLPESFELLLGAIELTVSGYEQLDTDTSFTWVIQSSEKSYFEQAGVQHTKSYPTVLGVPELNSVINKGTYLDDTAQA